MHLYWKLFRSFWVSSLFLFTISCTLHNPGGVINEQPSPEPELEKKSQQSVEENNPVPISEQDKSISQGEETTPAETRSLAEGKSKDYTQREEPQPKEEPQAMEEPQAKEEPQQKEEPQSSPKPEDYQALLDSALDYYQASNDFWEQGDLDNAIEALDKAFSLILKVDENDGAEILQQKEDLRITISKRIVEVYASRYTAVNGYHKAIPLVKNKHVEKAIALFQGRERDAFLAAYKRSGRYRPAIVRALEEEGLPEELSWLPLIESGYKIRALSRARALGLWQFIASTGYKFGLKRDTWIDERLDPEKSTQAAIAYLKELHNIFGDWSTVLAGYNCGELRVLGQIKRQKINYLDNFWDLYERLPRETAFYVPKFLAVLHITNDPKAYGFELPAVDQPIETESVNISKQVHLKTIAKHLEIDYTMLRDLNPELRQYLTPPGPYLLKVPNGEGESLIAELKDIPVWQPPVPLYVVHRVRRGESLSVIADNYKTSVRAIMDMNGLRSRSYIKSGWKLKIPAGRKYIPPERVASASTPSEQVIEHVVRKGDSLYSIANQYQTTTKALMAHNQLNNSELKIGQVLLINPNSSISNPDQIVKYRVRRGDSPYLIAKRYSMNLADFLKMNHLTPHSTIFPGQLVAVKYN